MANKSRLKGVRKSRTVGHKPKHNKKSVAERKRIKIQTAQKRRYIVDEK